MQQEIFHTRSEAETMTAGESVARRLPGRALVLLIGELGTGKTTLAKGIVNGLGAADPADVTSPTFTLIHEYGQVRTVYHIDLYRLGTLREAASLGLDELLDREAVVLVEWGERFPELWPAERVEIHLTTLEDDAREIRVSVTGYVTPELAPT